jgi:hypothetical protein
MAFYRVLVAENGRMREAGEVRLVERASNAELERVLADISVFAPRGQDRVKWTAEGATITDAHGDLVVLKKVERMKANAMRIRKDCAHCGHHMSAHRYDPAVRGGPQRCSVHGCRCTVFERAAKGARKVKLEANVRKQHFAGYDFSSGPEGTVVHRPHASELRSGDRVKYKDVNLTDQGTVVSASGKWAEVRWDRYPNTATREWADNLKVVSQMNRNSRHAQLDSRTREIAETAPILNDGEFDWKGEEGLLRIWMGQHAPTFLYYFGSSVEDAFEEAVEWADDHAPGLLFMLGLEEYKGAAEDEGIEWNDAWPDFEDPDFQRVVDAAEADMTIIGHTTLKNGNAVPSWEWGVDEIHGEEREIVTARAAPYTYRMTYEIVTPESAEDGDAAERGWEVEEPAGPFSLEDLVREVNDHTWVEWSNSNPTGQRGEWLISEAEQNYSTGEDTSYHLFIERVDGKPLSTAEIKDISKALGVSTFGMMFRT